MTVYGTIATVMQFSLWGSDGNSHADYLGGNNVFLKLVSSFVKNILELFFAVGVLIAAAVVVCGLV